MYDALIVGSGFFGATFARYLTDAGKKCLVIDKNPHIAGMAYDSKRENILVSEYGAHILHSNSDYVWQFMQQFTKIIPFINKPKAKAKNRIYSFPINLMTLQQVWGISTPEEGRRKLLEVRIPCEYPKNFEEWILDKVGRELYELFIYGYTKKQWGREPRELPASIIQRLPIRLTYNEDYFATKYQGMPVEGYAKLIENMLSGIDVRLGVDFFSLDWKKYAKRLVYSGPIDRLFDYCHGKLTYNSLRFEHKKFQGDYQGNAVINHTGAETPYLRSVEHKHFNSQGLQEKHDTLIVDRHKPTIVTFDYPAQEGESYYPLRDQRNSEIYVKYLKIIPNDITVGGRLGSYKYYDIDQTVAEALKKAETFS